MFPRRHPLTPASMQRVFAHEVVHSCLANLGSWPPWLHEGLAQKMSGDQLRQASLVRGQVPIAPTTASLRVSDRATGAIPRNIPGNSAGGGRFFGPAISDLSVVESSSLPGDEKISSLCVG